jgi:hypothetical protein
MTLFAITFAILIIIVARYLVLKIEHKELMYRYSNIVRIHRQKTMSENEEEQYEK